MPFKVYPIPNFTNTGLDLVFADTTAANSQCIVHYAFTVGADKGVVDRRSMTFTQIRDFAGAYQGQHPQIMIRLTKGQGYRPGECVLDREDLPDSDSDHDAIMRLGALELLGNISSGRLAPTDKDPFPHQLALQQHVRKLDAQKGVRRILIADEVGLGKTIEAALIIRDILLARGTVAGFSCLYLTSGGLVEDAVAKLRDVLSGSIDGQQLVSSVDSFRRYGEGNINGVYVASMHAARLYTSIRSKENLPKQFTPPQVIIIDECHHAASDVNLAGRLPTAQNQNQTQTYLAAYQLLAGEYWLNPQSQSPELAILMSATPFRSQPQFVNLLRLLTHGVQPPGQLETFQAYGANINAPALQNMIARDDSSAMVAWRRQSDPEVRSWDGYRIFPNLSIVRPHQVAEGDANTPRLPAPSQDFLNLVQNIKQTIRQVSKAHSEGFGGFATAQLKKC